MKKLSYLLLLIMAMVYTGCKDTGMLMPNPSGGAFEVLLVVDDKDYRTAAGQKIFEVLNSPVPHLPQVESQFRISRLQTSQFDKLLQTTRSIVFVVIDSTQYTRPTIRFINERWAKTQCIVNITGPNVQSVEAAIEENRQTIIDYLVTGERKRQIGYLQSNANKTASEKVFKKFGSNIVVPTSLTEYKEGEDCW